jgi:hypothetical protein
MWRALSVRNMRHNDNAVHGEITEFVELTPCLCVPSEASGALTIDDALYKKVLSPCEAAATDWAVRPSRPPCGR